ncbi:acyl-CoA dehydrogenase [Paenibacillus sp. 1001270B_150601_E10]|uniref:acyl-CoA dehydrogenase n=1 Tax=Paenibacillus sp. 1001270B_150601_E10 TaxID=2787079 RepID=UPI00189EEF81|nr:acyl-CoA dehydrogenase [Paenibacillus sp. 1001270B_150601_E10]
MKARYWTEEQIGRIRARSLGMERAGAVDQEWLNHMVQHKLFKLFVPEVLGGTMTSLPEALKVFEESAWIDGALGWTVTIGAGGGFFVPFMKPDICKGQFLPESAVIAGSGQPTGTAVPVEGGYRVSGSWKYCSGAHHATMFTANVLVKASEETDEPIIRACIFQPEQVSIIEDWDAFGMKATGSHTIKVEDVFVPEEMTFSLLHAYPDYDHSLYHYPFALFAETSFAALILGVGRHFLDEAHLMLADKKESFPPPSAERMEGMTKVLQHAEIQLKEITSCFYEIVTKSWETMLSQGEISEDMIEEVSRNTKLAARAVREMADGVFPYMGLLAIMESNRLNHIWRDLQTACQHSSLLTFEGIE